MVPRSAAGACADGLGLENEDSMPARGAAPKTTDQLLREQQDSEYRQSLLRDQEKARGGSPCRVGSRAKHHAVWDAVP